jgi:hypothetical protein
VKHLTEAQFNQYLDHELDKEAQLQMKAHLETCANCRARFDELRMVFSALAEVPDMPLDRDLTTSIIANLPQTSKRPALWRQPAFIMQSILTVVLLILSMPIFRIWGPKVVVWFEGLKLSAIQIPSLPVLIDQIAGLLSSRPRLTFTMPRLPELSALLSGSDFNIVLVLLMMTGALWMIGNLSLLRNGSGTPE